VTLRWRFERIEGEDGWTENNMRAGRLEPCRFQRCDVPSFRNAPDDAERTGDCRLFRSGVAALTESRTFLGWEVIGSQALPNAGQRRDGRERDEDRAGQGPPSPEGPGQSTLHDV
jgi:hypothetical protein